jgi:zinc protease
MTYRLALFLLISLLLAACAPAGQLPSLFTVQPAGGAQSVEPPADETSAAEQPDVDETSQGEPLASDSAALRMDDLLPLDPAVRVGRLDNGLTYYVQRNSKPAQRAELWLVVNAGSVLEEEGEQGLAHFLEHMLFNGTRRFPEQTLIDTLERMGMEFGPDVNAYTSFDETVYMLQAPTDQEDLLPVALDVLEDWAAYATLSAEEIDKERGVVIEEQRLVDQNAEGRIFSQTWPALTAGTTYAGRLPIGDMDVIRSAPAEALRRFYQTWYRPDLMAVIAVGDFDPDQVETMIRDRFATLPELAAPQPRLEPDAPPVQERRFLVVADPEYPYTEFRIDHVGPITPMQTVGDARDWLVAYLASDMFDARLDEISRKPDAPFVYAYALVEPLARQAETYSVRGQTQEGEALAGIEAVLAEIERIRRHGFTQAELERARADLALSYQTWRAEEDNLDSAVFAQGYADHYLTGLASPSVDYNVDLVQQLLPGISLTETVQAFQVLAPVDGQLVTVLGPAKEDVALPSQQELAAVFDHVTAQTLASREYDSGNQRLMDEAPPPAEIVSEQAWPETGISQFELANGVRVIVKPTDFWADDIVFSATSPGGTSLVADEDFNEAAVVAHLVSQSGVGELSQSELQGLLAGKTAQVAPGIYEQSEDFSGYTTAQDLELAFQLIYLYATEPRLDPAAVQVYQNQARAALINRTVTPYAALQDALVDALYGDTVRRGPLPLEQIDQFDPERAMAVYRDRFADMSDFTFTFVGNVDEAEIRRLAQRYLGALPGGGRQESGRDVAPMQWSDVVERTVVKGQEEQSLVQLVFAGPISVTQESAVQLDALEALLAIRLRNDLREARSGIYTPFVSSNLSIVPTPQYELWVEFGADPQRVDELVGALFDQIADLQGNGPTPDELAKVQEQLRRNRQEALSDNDFWLWTIEQHFTTPGGSPDGILAYDALLEALQPADLQAAALRFLPQDRYVRVTLYPEGFEPEIQ